MADKPRGKVVFKRRPPEPVVGPKGEQGEQGLQGIPGETGPVGPEGKQGLQGARGLQGKLGLKGDPGKDGARGPQGPPGKDGVDGKDGRDGKDGADGKDGKDGASAYEIWLKTNPGKSEADYLKAMVRQHGSSALSVIGGGGGFAAASRAEANSAPRMDGEPNGFPNRDDVTLSWDNGTRTLTLTGEYDIFTDGTKYPRYGGSIQIADTEGAHFIYYDSEGVLTEVDTFDPEIILRYCFVAEVYWDADNSVAIPWVVNELHGCEWPAELHQYHHQVDGAVYISGLGLAGLTVSNNPTGGDDNQCQFTAEGGEIRDEDIPHGIQIRNSLTDTIPVLWREGTEASPVWRMDDTRSFPVTNVGTTNGRVMWNELTGGSWQLTEVASDNNFILAHVYAIPGLNTSTGNLVAIVGQSEYNNVTSARAGAEAEALALVLDGLPTLEFVLVATLIVKTNDSWSNSPKAGFVLTDTGSDYIDWRQTPKTAGAGTSGHTHEPKSATLTRDGLGQVETVTVEGEDTWILSRNPDESVASLTNGTYNVAVDRDGDGVVTGITVT